MSEITSIGDENTGYPNILPPDPMSVACATFFHDHLEVGSFLGYVFMLAVDADAFARGVGGVHAHNKNLPEHQRAKFQMLLHEGAGAWITIEGHHQLLLQVTLCRSVDNYLNYLSELLTLIFSTRPEMLKSAEKVTMEEVLKHKTMAEVISHFVEQRVHDLSYKGMRELSKYLSERLGFPVFETEDSLDHAIRIIELRNIITHNRAIVNNIFLSRLPNYPSKRGEKIVFQTMEVFGDIDFLARSVCDLDNRASEKFGIPMQVPRDKYVDQINRLDSILARVEGELKAQQKNRQS